VKSIWLPLFLPFLLLSFISTALAQNSSHAVVHREIGAVQVLQRALDAMGGQGMVANIHSMVATGTIQQDADSPPKAFIWKDTFIGQRFDFRRELSDSSSRSVLVSGHSHPQHLGAGGKAASLSTHVATAMSPLHNPAVVLWMALNKSTVSVETTDDGSAPGAIHIRIRDERSLETRAVTQQDWFIDRQTMLPARVQYFTPEVGNGFEGIIGTCEFDHFENVEGILIPMILSLSDRDSQSRVIVKSIQLNAAISDSDFDLGTQEAAQ